jgi:hypothetical protein
MRRIIKKGWHYTHIFPELHKDVRSFELTGIKFCKSAWYYKCDVEHTGINKFQGLGFGLNHHKNSIRIGWQPDFENEGTFDIWVYWYDQSKEGYQKQWLRKLAIDEIIDIKVIINPESYSIACTGIEGTAVPKTHCKSWGLILFDYFGGKSKSPKDIIFFYEFKNL